MTSRLLTPHGRAGPLRPRLRCRPLASQCTTSPSGRTISIHAHEALLTRARLRQQDPAGGRTTAPPDRRWNASWRTCSAAATAGGAPGCRAWSGSPRTGGGWPPRSTSPGWLHSASGIDTAAGRSRPHRTLHQDTPLAQPTRDLVLRDGFVGDGSGVAAGGVGRVLGHDGVGHGRGRAWAWWCPGRDRGRGHRVRVA